MITVSIYIANHFIPTGVTVKEEIVVSIGGSIMLPKDRDVSYLRSLADTLRICSKSYSLYLVVGGGWIARKYINWGRELEADEASLDELGISVSRLNAKLLSLALGKDVNPTPARNFHEAMMAGRHYPMVVMGGTHPGHTTDAVSAMLAERLRCKRLINVTSVDGVYSEDPRKNEKAERYDELDYDSLISIVEKVEGGAGPNVVFDPLAAKIIKRARIKAYILSGDDLENLSSAIGDKDFHGTIVE